MGLAVKYVATGIGLASEAIAVYKPKKADKACETPTPILKSGSSSTSEVSSISGISSPSESSSISGASSTTAATSTSDVVHISLEGYDKTIEKDYATPVGYPSDASPERPYTPGDTVDDEEIWALDEACTELKQPENSKLEVAKPDVRRCLRKFLLAHPVPSNFALTKLPYPVVMPQQRPRTLTRGFVRAYAPVLAGAGIDQDTWMNFLDIFERSVRASPIFDALIVASNVIGLLPEVSVMVLAAGIGTVGFAGKVIHARSRTNTFLDDVNQHFFRPRGLYALLIRYSDSSNKGSSGPIDISHAVAKSVTPADARKIGNLGAKLKHNMKSSGGKSYGEMGIPTAAPLIYPTLDKAVTAAAAATSASDGKTSSKWTEKFIPNTAFVRSYLDRRAQADFHHRNPSAQALHMPEEQRARFASRYADPTHPASNGHLISLLTGGRVVPRERSQQRKDPENEGGEKDEDEKETAEREQQEQQPQQQRRRRSYQPPKPVKRLVREDVLYLMVVNMPSEAEMARARATLEKQVRVEKAEGSEEPMLVVDADADV